MKHYLVENYIDVISFTSSGSVSVGAESDTLDAATVQFRDPVDFDTSNDINVGILTAKSGVYADVIRRLLITAQILK